LHPENVEKTVPCILNTGVVKGIETEIGDSFPLQFSQDSCNRTLSAFLQLRMQDRCSLLDLPAQNFHAYIQHYYRCKSRAPHQTSACILVPNTKGPWSQYRSALIVVKKIPKGTPLFVDPRTHQSIPAIRRMVVLYDPPLPLLKLHAFTDDTQPLHMTFPSYLAGQHVSVLVDAGASHSFMDETFASNHGFHITPDSGSVHCGGRTTAAIQGYVTALLQMRPGYRQQVKFYITSLPDDHPVILGNTCLIANQVILNYASRTMEVTKASKTSTFFCPEVRSSISGGDQPGAKTLKNGNRTPFGVCHGLGGFTHTDPTWIILLGRQFVDRLRKDDPLDQIPRQPIALCISV
jgi:hypothetical protein